MVRVEPMLRTVSLEHTPGGSSGGDRDAGRRHPVEDRGPELPCRSTGQWAGNGTRPAV